MPAITRTGPSRYSATRSRAVIHAGNVLTVATATTKTKSLYEQSKDALANVDKQLKEAGSDKSHIMMVMIYITDIARKEELNRAWDEWVDRANPPLRACVGVALEKDDLVEFVVSAVTVEEAGR